MIHDIINDLAQRIARDICFKIEDKIGGNNERKPCKKARHSSYLDSKFDGIKSLRIFMISVLNIEGATALIGRIASANR